MTSDFFVEIGSTYLPKIGETSVPTLVLLLGNYLHTTKYVHSWNLERPACNVVYDITTIIDLFI